MSSIRDALAIFWAGLELCHSQSSLPRLLSTAFLSSVVFPRSRHLPSSGVSVATGLHLHHHPPWAKFGYSDLVPSFQAPSSLHDPFIPGASPAPEGAPTPVVSPGLSQCQSLTGLHAFVPPKLVPSKKLFHITNCFSRHRVWLWVPLDHSFWLLTLRNHLSYHKISPQ